MKRRYKVCPIMICEDEFTICHMNVEQQVHGRQCGCDGFTGRQLQTSRLEDWASLALSDVPDWQFKERHTIVLLIGNSLS